MTSIWNPSPTPGFTLPGPVGGGQPVQPVNPYATTRNTPGGAVTVSGGGGGGMAGGGMPDMSGVLRYLMQQKAKEQANADREAALRRRMLIEEMESRRGPNASPAGHGGPAVANPEQGDYLWTTYPSGFNMMGGPVTSTNYTSGAVSGGRLPAGAKQAASSSFGGMIPDSKAGLSKEAPKPSSSNDASVWESLPDYFRVQQMLKARG